MSKKRKKGNKVVRQVPYELRELSSFQQKGYLRMVGRWNRSKNKHNVHREQRGNRRKP